MQVLGKWFLCDDGVTRPSVEVHVFDVDNRSHHEIFLVDNGCDIRHGRPPHPFLPAFAAALWTGADRHFHGP